MADTHVFRFAGGAQLLTCASSIALDWFSEHMLHRRIARLYPVRPWQSVLVTQRVGSSRLGNTTDSPVVQALTGEEREVPGAYIEFAERRALPEFADMPVGSASIGRWLTAPLCAQ